MQGTVAETPRTESGSILLGETVVDDSLPVPSPISGDSTFAALAYIHSLLVRPTIEQPLLAGLLTDLAAAFQASAAGLASLPDGRERLRFPTRPDDPEPDLPWRDDPSLLDAGQAPAAVRVQRNNGCLLATTLQGQEGTTWVLWLEYCLDDVLHGQKRCWTDGEAGALVLAGHALARWLGSDSSQNRGRARWAEQLDRITRQQRLETAAAVTRRLAHDFGNVLTGILGFTELALAQQVPANTPLHTYISEVYRAAQSGAQLTHQLRMFSRRQSSSSSSCQLNTVLRQAVVATLRVPEVAGHKGEGVWGG